MGFLLTTSKELKENEALLRVGRYCGKEFIIKGLEENKKPVTKSIFRMREKGGRIDEPPFGWLKVELIEDNRDLEDNQTIKSNSKLKNLSPEELINSYINNMPLLINDMRDGKIENFEDIKYELAKEIKKELQKNPRTWEKAKKKALKRKEYIESLLKEKK